MVEGNIFLWASNREIKDYLEFASEEPCDDHHIRIVHCGILSVIDHELTHSLFTRYTGSSPFFEHPFFSLDKRVLLKSRAV